ncbi:MULTISPECIES: helix-turn-helix domain-containing protein [Rahnella]|uniref:XRE family transcriptional regulator n=1 Tax=Rahnella laticis TaxID=2787622 RepID=A0ABS0E324_9GAMM|nr:MULTISPECIES: XRE family transcriptional regulator [Rahnella]MBF7979492.1 XRE family transcriptional regulator [Rahnella laticis]MBF7999243.1 XRE family transcriptional regulator [Rahnella sp. LAC-M12]
MIEEFDSIWDAIEDTPERAENMKVRSKLMRVLTAHIENNKMTQAQAAKFFGVTQPRISDLVRGKISVFSIDMLVNMLASAELRISNIEINGIAVA